MGKKMWVLIGLIVGRKRFEMVTLKIAYDFQT